MYRDVQVGCPTDNVQCGAKYLEYYKSCTFDSTSALAFGTRHILASSDRLSKPLIKYNYSLSVCQWDKQPENVSTEQSTLQAVCTVTHSKADHWHYHLTCDCHLLALYNFYIRTYVRTSINQSI